MQELLLVHGLLVERQLMVDNLIDSTVLHRGQHRHPSSALAMLLLQLAAPLTEDEA